MSMLLRFICTLCVSVSFSATAAELSFTPVEAGRPPQISASGSAGPRAVLQLCVKFDLGRNHCSVAVFDTRGGAIDTARDAPSDGAYSGVDPYGLFWSAAEFTAEEVSASFGAPVLAKLEQTPIGHAVLAVRRPKADGGEMLAMQVLTADQLPVQIKQIDVGAVKGRLYSKSQTAPLAVVLVLNGCPEGEGKSRLDAFLATRGYLLFNAFYTSDNHPGSRYGCAGELALPEEALLWLRSQYPDKPLFIMGKSRGAEAAFWLAHFNKPLVDGVISFNGTAIQAPTILGGAWFYKGQKLPALPTGINTASRKLAYRSTGLFAKLKGEAPDYSQTSAIEAELASFKEEEIDATAIPLDCRLPALVILSEKDELTASAATRAMFTRRCVTALEVVWNEGATHGTFDPGWDNHRTFKTPVRGGLHGAEYKANVRASYANVTAIQRFLTANLARKVAAGTNDQNETP